MKFVSYNLQSKNLVHKVADFRVQNVLKVTYEHISDLLPKIFRWRNLVKPSEMPRPLALTGITAHTQKHFTSSDKTQKKKKKKYI